MNLSLNDEPQSDWSSLRRSFLDHFHARIRDASGIEQRLERVAHAHCRKLCVGCDLEHGEEFSLSVWRGSGGAFEDKLDRTDLPALVILDARVASLF